MRRDEDHCPAFRAACIRGPPGAFRQAKAPGTKPLVLPVAPMRPTEIRDEPESQCTRYGFAQSRQGKALRGYERRYVASQDAEAATTSTRCTCMTLLGQQKGNLEEAHAGRERERKQPRSKPEREKTQNTEVSRGKRFSGIEDNKGARTSKARPGDGRYRLPPSPEHAWPCPARTRRQLHLTR